MTVLRLAIRARCAFWAMYLKVREAGRIGTRGVAVWPATVVIALCLLGIEFGMALIRSTGGAR